MPALVGDEDTPAARIDKVCHERGLFGVKYISSSRTLDVDDVLDVGDLRALLKAMETS